MTDKYIIETRHMITKGVGGGYRYGKPEGVVMHSSANPSSTMENEISYMTRNYQNAFVHAWAGEKIVEIYNTDYACWGAGPQGNARFAQIEVVENINYYGDQGILDCIDRQCYWTAVQLCYYNLPCTDATKNGNGTVWTHKAVSQFLGGTDHQDPIAFYAKAGTNWTEVFNQVKAYYDTYKTGNTANVVSLSQKQGNSAVIKDNQPKKYECHNADKDGRSTKFKAGAIVKVNSIATHWIRVLHSDGKYSYGDPVTDTDKEHDWKVEENCTDGSIKLTYADQSSKACFYAYDRDFDLKDSKLYRVQTGAYANKDNADRQAEKMRKDGYDTFVTKG